MPYLSTRSVKLLQPHNISGRMYVVIDFCEVAPIFFPRPKRLLCRLFEAFEFFDHITLEFRNETAF